MTESIVGNVDILVVLTCAVTITWIPVDISNADIKESVQHILILHWCFTFM